MSVECGESFQCGACARWVRRLEGSGIVKVRGVAQRVCPDCKRAARAARKAAIAEQRRVGRILNALREHERHDLERAWKA